MMHRIGIMGGMFDPVHTGHMQLARTALQVLKLDRLHLVPCAVPNHRGRASASQNHRKAMLEIAVDSDERFVVDDREYQREGVSYAVDTLKSFATEFPGATLVYVQGWDSFNSLPTWHRWQELFLFCHICAVSRPGQMLPTENSPPGSTAAMLYDELRCRQVESVDALFASDHGRILVLRDVALDVSSSEVREALSKGGDAQNVCTGVEQYIKQHQLYRI
jgi:nicotinate-nucleotide adenylyltransferase